MEKETLLLQIKKTIRWQKNKPAIAGTLFLLVMLILLVSIKYIAH